MKKKLSIFLAVASVLAISLSMTACQKNSSSAETPVSTSQSVAEETAASVETQTPKELSESIIKEQGAEPLSDTDYEKALAATDKYVKETSPVKDYETTFMYYEPNQALNPDVVASVDTTQTEKNWTFVYTAADEEFAVYFNVYVDATSLNATSDNFEEVYAAVKQAIAEMEAASATSATAATEATSESSSGIEGNTESVVPSESTASSVAADSAAQ